MVDKIGPVKSETGCMYIGEKMVKKANKKAVECK